MFTQSLLIVDQVTSFFANDFAITDDQGAPLGTIRTEDGVGSRLLMGNRELSVYNNEGELQVHLSDVPNFGLDSFELTGPSGEAIGTIYKEFTFFSKRLSVELPAAPDAGTTTDRLEISGDLFDYDFTATLNGQPAAQVARRWPGLGEALLGHNRYVVLFDRSLPELPRKALLGAVIALDLIRAKKRRNSANT
ncbi:MAG: phospholipid scramblase-related protein [Nocardioides sp.]